MNKINVEIQNELLEIAPTLARLREKNGTVPFITPPHYFDTLADNVLAKISNAPSALNFEPFDLGHQLSHPTNFTKLTEQNLKLKAKNAWLKTGRLKLMAVAATFVIATALVWLVPKTFNSFKSGSGIVNAPFDYSQLNEEDIHALLHECKTELDADFLTDKLGVTEKELSLNAPENAINNSEENLNDAIDKYIKENDTTNNL